MFAIHKAAGWTSHDVVAKVRRIAHLKRVGHAGTLDPAATGVLPVCLGQATRVVEYLSDTGKAYRATITFGVETNTYDAEGEVTATLPLPATLDAAAIAAVLPQFLGQIMQVPPIFSALKRNGQRLYDLARAGVEVQIDPRPVQIDALTIVDWHTPTLVLDVACGKGTYIRSLAHDLGAVFGCGAHLAALVRTRVGPFALAQTLSLETLATAFDDGTWVNHFYAPDEALLTMPAAILAEGNAGRLRNGQLIHFPLRGDAEQVRAYSTDGRFLGILARRAPDGWQPDKVFAVTPLAEPMKAADA
ncbi:MAG: tRNA pseudouridine(55) synthase TruB [Ktedonobacterales bacterium]|nr:tRNA pseudouridine(55) synthase TruB [Ktedonobacterales bacterium]